jgi:integrase
MGSVFKRKDSKYYWCKFTDSGTRVEESTKKTCRTDAIEYLEKRQATLKHYDDPRIAYTMLLACLGASPHEQPLRKEFGIALIEGSDAGEATALRIANTLPADAQERILEALQVTIQIDSPSLDAAYDAFLHEPKKKPPTAGTLKAYMSLWKRFTRWSVKHDIATIADITEISASEYASHLQTLKIGASTYNHHLQLLRAVQAAAIRKKWASTNPWMAIPRMSKDTVNKRNLTLKELQCVLKQTTGWMTGLFTVGIYTGLRLADCVYLRTDKVDIENGFIHARPIKTERMRKEVSIPIHPALMGIISGKAKEKRTYIFPEAVALYEAYPNAPGSALIKAIQEQFTDAGIETREEIKGRKRKATVVGFHSLRHSFVTLAAEAGVDEATLMNMVGHGSPAMTRIYNHISDDRKKEAVGKLPTV